MLEVKQVSKLYENKRGVDQIDFSMKRGEVVGFLGPNGAGKTTTMRMITGYLNPTKGNILVDGLSMADHPRKARRKIGYLPETPPLYPEMTILAYLKFIADLRDVPAKQQKKRIEEVVSKLGLRGREQQIIRSLSKGYKQRVGLAQAILHNPDLLIMDEPTSGLDPNQIIEIRQLIRELGENHTVLLSTHILPEVNALCNRVLIINKGRIVLDEKPDRIGSSMGDSFEISLQVKASKENALKVVRSLGGLDSVQVVDAPPGVEDGSITRLTVKSKSNTDFREQLFYKLAESRLPILEMKKESRSLEDIFTQLTTTEPASAAAAHQEPAAEPAAAEATESEENETEVDDRA